MEKHDLKKDPMRTYLSVNFYDNDMVDPLIFFEAKCEQTFIGGMTWKDLTNESKQRYFNTRCNGELKLWFSRINNKFHTDNICKKVDRKDGVSGVFDLMIFNTELYNQTKS